MPRIRTVKPDHWNDKGLTSISLQAHLLWIASWNFSDDQGVFENDPLLIKSQIFPRRTDIRTEQITSWLDQLVNARYIVPFDYNGQGYYISRTFGTHQRIDKPQPSKIPEDILRTVLERSANSRDHSSLYSSVEESRVKDGSMAVSPPAPRFVKPEEGTLTNYFMQLNLDDISAQAQAALFLDYYNSNGWRVGKSPMKDWEAAARNWKKRMQEFKKSDHAAHQQSSSNNGAKLGTSAARIEVARKW